MKTSTYSGCRAFHILAILLFIPCHPTYSQFVPARIMDEGCARKASILSNTSLSQPSLASSTVNATYYNLDLTISTSPQYLRGKVTVEAISLVDSLASLTLDLSDPMTVDSVLMQGIAVSFSRQTNAVRVALDRVYGNGEPVVLDVYYRGIPVPTGFGSFLFSSHGGTPWVWSLSQPYGARDWWPSIDHPLDKADSVDVWVTCDTTLKVGSNGKLVGITNHGNGTHTYKWAERYPIATYLVSIALSNFAIFSDWFHYSATDSMEILNYVLPEQLPFAQQDLAMTVDALHIFSSAFGLYPFINEKYGHSSFGRGGAMEHQTMTSTTNFDEYVIAHELAHQWFGDLITCATWKDLWLNEGFATYSEALYGDAMYGNDLYRARMNSRMTSALRAQGTLVVQDTSTVANMFNSDRVYAKGASALHMLRHVLGDSTFFRVLRTYVADSRFRYATATTADFQQTCEQVSGYSLSYFFDQWVYGEGFPKYSLEWHSVSDSTAYRITVQINQQTSTANPLFFTMPIDIRLVDGEWDSTIVVFHRFTGQEFTIRSPRNPTAVLLDPDHWILGENQQSLNPLPQDFRLDQNFPNPFNPGTVIQFHLPRRTRVILKIFNILGEEIVSLFDGQAEAGSYTVPWDGRSGNGKTLPSGVYFYRVEADSHTSTRKMVLIR